MGMKIVIPEVGESITSGVIAAWVKKDGEYVERDETVLELETDKITMEIPAPAAGVLKTGANEGDEVEVGSTVGEIDESASKPAGGAAPAEAAQEASAGGSATATQAPPKAPAEAPAPAPAAPEPSRNGHSSNGDVRATPLARKIAADLGVDLGGVHGTGPGDRVTEQDVIAAAEQRVGSGAAATPAASPATGSRDRTVERMSPMRQRIAARLVEAQQTAAMLTTFNEADMSAVMDLRKRYKEEFKDKHEIGLGFMSFFVKAACSALRAYPMVNSFIVQDENGSPAVEKHDYCDVSVAVSSPKGLVVPVLRDAHAMSFATVESTIKDLAIRARDGKITLDEMTGGTFTITNGGIFGSMMSTPILNPPQSAILGMHAINRRPVEHPLGSGNVAIRPMMYLALSYDHRVVDGAEAVSFLVHIKKAIEDPERLLLEI
ncbi:MAG: 2-oxoglutarate dehydrogenase complex dihydrolipoyllysine-residue succinyltransferase [Planctomycetota bacterium]